MSQSGKLRCQYRRSYSAAARFHECTFTDTDRIEDAHGFAAQAAVAMGRGAALSNTGRLFVFDVH